jgi:hypothetical protein
MIQTNPQRPALGLATLMMLLAPRGSDHATVMLSRIVEAQAAADEANDLLSLGAIDHARYERAACDRDDAVEAAAAFLGRDSR